MSDWSLARLLRPVAWADFATRYWQRQPLHVAHHNPGFYDELIDQSEVDHLIATHTGRRDFPLSVIGGFRGAAAEAAAAPTARSEWTAEAVYARLARGATIRIGNTPEYVAAIRRLVASFELELNTDISVNLYLTPAGARAFEAHYDDHDVFVVQVKGNKTWKMFTPPQELPLEVIFRGRDDWLRRPLPYETSLKTLPSFDEGPEFKLTAGDLLYVPRGHVHQVFTENSPSLHLTIAAPVVTWYEVAVQALLAASRRDRQLREALPLGFAADNERRLLAANHAPRIIEALQRHLTADDLAQALAKLADQFVYSRKADWQGAAGDVMRASSVTTDTWLAIRSPLAFATRIIEANVHLLFAGREVTVPIRAQDMLEYILKQQRFRVGDLPGDLDDASRVLLARKLLEKGFLTFADPA